MFTHNLKNLYVYDLPVLLLIANSISILHSNFHGVKYILPNLRLPDRSPVSEKSPKHKPPPPKRTDSLLSEEITPPKEILEKISPPPVPADDHTNTDYSGEIKPEVEKAILAHWTGVGMSLYYALFRIRIHLNPAGS